MKFLSEVFCVLKLIKNKDAFKKCDSDHYNILFDAEAFVNQQNFSYDYLTNIYNNIIPNMKLVDTTFSRKTEILSERLSIGSHMWIFQCFWCYSP